MGSFYTQSSLPDASFTERGAVSTGAQELRGPKSIRTDYSQNKTFSAVPVNFASTALALGFPEDWDIGDPNDFGTSDLMPDGLHSFVMTAPSIPGFAYEMLALGFSVDAPGDDGSYFDFDSFTQGGLQIIRDAIEGEVRTTIRAADADGNSSEIVLNPAFINFNSPDVQFPLLDELSVTALTVTNINGIPYVPASEPVIQSVVEGANGKGLQLDEGTGALSFVPDTTFWVGQSSGIVTLSGSSATLCSGTGSSPFVSPADSPTAFWLLTINGVLENTDGATVIVGFKISLDGGSTFLYGTTDLPTAAAGANSVTPFCISFPIGIPPGTYTASNILIAAESAGDISIGITGSGSTKAWIVRLN